MATPLYSRYSLPSEAIAHLLLRLEARSPLGKLCVDRISWEGGTFYTVLPTGTPDSRLGNVRAGGVSFDRAPRAWLSANVSRYLGFAERSTFVFEDDDQRKKDLGKLWEIGTVVFWNDRVLHTVRHSDREQEFLEEIPYSVCSFAMLGLGFNDCNGCLVVSRYASVTDEQITEIVVRSDVIVVDACDGESYAIWVRRSIGEEHLPLVPER